MGLRNPTGATAARDTLLRPPAAPPRLPRSYRNDGWNVCVVYCLDAHFITDIAKFMAGALQVRDLACFRAANKPTQTHTPPHAHTVSQEPILACALSTQTRAPFPIVPSYACTFCLVCFHNTPHAGAPDRTCHT